MVDRRSTPATAFVPAPDGPPVEPPVEPSGRQPVEPSVEPPGISPTFADAGLNRCPWPGNDAQYIRYHDTEWGVPQTDGNKLFEKLVLESFQAGLSWITILRKREAFREAFVGFDTAEIATWGDPEIETLMQNAGIVRNRAKISATIANAGAFNALGGPDAFSQVCWESVGHVPRQNAFYSMADVPASTQTSAELAKTLKRRGFRFFGPTTAYAFMQSMGLVNDHLVGCPRRAACAALAAQLPSPGGGT